MPYEHLRTLHSYATPPCRHQNDRAGNKFNYFCLYDGVREVYGKITSGRAERRQLVDLNQDTLLTVADVAAMFGCRTLAVYEWVRKKQIEYLRVDTIVGGRKQRVIKFEPEVVLAYFGEEGYDPGDQLLYTGEVEPILRYEKNTGGGLNKRLANGLFGAIQTPGGRYLTRKSRLDAFLEDPRGLRDGFQKPEKDRLLIGSEVCPIFRIARPTLNKWTTNRWIPYLQIETGRNPRTLFWESVVLSYFGEEGYDSNNPPLSQAEVCEMAEGSPADVRFWIAEGVLSPIATPSPAHQLFRPNDVNRLLITQITTGQN